MARKPREGTAAERDAKVRSAMMTANVPTHVFRKTLPLLGQQDLRIWVESTAYIDGRNMTENMFFYPMHSRDVVYVRDVVYTLGKELVLHGEKILIIPLLRLAECLKYDSAESELLRNQMYNCVILIVMDFYENGAACPLNPKELAMVRNELRERMEDANRGLILHSQNEPSHSSWWADSFMQEIISQSTIIALADKEKL